MFITQAPSANRNTRHIGRELQTYLSTALRDDLYAGAAVAMVAIPQAMAYAAILGVSPLYGLYTAIVPTIVGAALGSAAFLITGPTNATALATASVLTNYAGRPGFVEYVFAVAILAGLIKLALGVLRFGGITHYVSNSVLTGFLAGVGILIILTQVDNLLGLPRAASGESVWTLQGLASIALRLAHLNLCTLLVSLLTMSVMLGCQRLSRHLPGPLLAVTGASLLVWSTGWKGQGVALVSGMGGLGLHYPAWHVPAVSLADVSGLVTGAGAVALLSLVEAVSVAKSVAARSGHRMDPSREFIGQGAASLVGGFFGCIPSSGSPSRTAVAYSSGARTRTVGVVAGLIVLVTLLAFSSLLHWVPMASLAAVVILSSRALFNVEHITLTWRSRSVSRLVMLATFAAALLLPLQTAIYVGVLLSVGIYLFESSHLRLTYLIPAAGGQMLEHSLADLRSARPPLAIINVEGSLYFAAVENLEEQVFQVLQAGTKVIVLRVRSAHLLASTGASALRDLILRARALGAEILICGADDTLLATLEAAGLANLLGPSHLFRASEVLFQSTRAALERAEELLRGQETEHPQHT
jgi:sulfate permease, SulP family